MPAFSRRDFVRTLSTLPALAASWAQSPRETRNVLLVMSDGLRWQEIFHGVDPELISKENGVGDPDAFRRLYWRDTAEARRKVLMPFLWNTVARQGQIFGNRKAGSEVSVSNGLNFSYPGYSETLCGFADPRVNSNDKVPNPNVTVLEWLHQKPEFHGRIAAFGAWDVFPYILNSARSGILVNAGYDPLAAPPISERINFLNHLKSESKVWADEAFDPYTFHTALEYLKLHKPRVLFLSLGETDEWAHEGKYEAYAESIRRVDREVEELWNTVQSLEEYRGKTYLILTCDHGRGDAPTEWKHHGEKVPNSKYIWMAFLGPDTPALGERRGTPPLQQNQIAATLAAFLGEDYRAAVPKAGAPVADVLAAQSAGQ